MARLIDADEAKAKIIAFSTECNSTVLPIDAILMILNQIDAADAVKLVRCKDCRYWEKFQSSILGEVMCCIAQGEMNVQKDPNDFCSYGERKEGAD